MKLKLINTLLAVLFVIPNIFGTVSASGPAPQIKFKVITEVNGTEVPAPDMYVETFHLFGQTGKGAVVPFRYRKTNAQGDINLEPDKVNNNDATPIDIDGDGKTDTFNLPRYPQFLSVEFGDDGDGEARPGPLMNNTIDINGTPVTADVKYCMSAPTYRYSSRYTSASNLGSPECEITDSLDLFCDKGPFFARLVPRHDMNANDIEIVGVTNAGGAIQAIPDCAAPYPQPGGDYNNYYNACQQDDPFGRPGKVIRWTHPNGGTFLTFKFQVSKATPTTAPTQVKEQKTTSVNIDDASTGWNNFACVNAQSCNATNSCPEYPEDSTKRRIKITDIQSSVDMNRISEETPLYFVECLIDETDPDADAVSERNKYRCSTGNTGIDGQLGITSSNSGSGTAPSGIRLFAEDGKTPLQNGFTAEQLRDTDYTVYLESNVPNNVGSVITVAYKGLAPAEIGSGTAGGLQQATLDFSGACFFHDPYGRVFDSHTLEPLSKATVTLNQKSSNNTFTPVTQASVGIGFVNPQTTNKDGLFAFLVPDGTYRLDAERTGYIGIAPENGVKSAHTFLYENLYNGGDIVQKGSVVQTDIPLKPFSTEEAETFARLNPVTVMEYFQSMDQKKTLYRIEGRTSHPAAIVELYAGVADKSRAGVINKTRTLAKTESDKYGRFTITFDISKLKNNEIISALTVSKPSMYLGAHSDATKTTLEISPMLASLKGVAYDANGAILPGARVAVMVPMSSVPVYETTADESGYFEVPEENIPSIQYELSYTPVSGETIQTTTDMFFAQNADTPANRFIAAGEIGTAVLGITDSNKATMITIWAIILGGLGALVFLSVIASSIASKRFRSKK